MMPKDKRKEIAGAILNNGIAADVILRPTSLPKVEHSPRCYRKKNQKYSSHQPHKCHRQIALQCRSQCFWPPKTHVFLVPRFGFALLAYARTRHPRSCCRQNKTHGMHRTQGIHKNCNHIIPLPLNEYFILFQLSGLDTFYLHEQIFAEMNFNFGLSSVGRSASPIDRRTETSRRKS